MADAIRDAYDDRAQEYTLLNLGELERVPFDRERLDAFADLVGPVTGPVADVGCGPGHIVDHLAKRGVTATGYDLSPAMIGEARRRFPASRFEVGDLGALDLADGSLAGLVARYSLIHLAPARLARVFDEWARVLAPNAPVLVAFFAASSRETHGAPFDHAVATAYALWPEAVEAQLASAGFDRFEVAMRAPFEGERHLDHATVLARRVGASPERTFA